MNSSATGWMMESTLTNTTTRSASASGSESAAHNKVPARSKPSAANNLETEEPRVKKEDLISAIQYSPLP